MKHLVNGFRKGSEAGFLWLAGLVAVAIGGFVIFLSFQVEKGFAETLALRERVTDSYELRAELERVLSLHQDLEIGQRGYVLTGNSQFLAPYERAHHEVGAALKLIATYGRSNPAHRLELAELTRLSQLKQEFTSATVATARTGGLEEARAQIATGFGKETMDRIRAVIATMDTREREQLAERTREADAVRKRLRTRIAALQIVLISVLLVALAMLVRAYRGWQRTLDRARDLAARQAAIFAGARDGMVVINESGGIESLNPAAAEMFGFDQDELLRRDVGILFEVAPDRGRVETFLRRLGAGRKSSAGEAQDFMGRRRDSSLFPAAVSISPVELGGQMRFLAVIRDITERLQVDRMKTEFVSTVSHELRTPLTSIAGSLGLIAGGAAGEVPEKARRLVEIARSNCGRLIRLINDILDIEKIESGKMHFESRPISLSNLLSQAVEANREFAAGHDVSIELESVPETAWILGDEDRVMQVVTNLLSNAAKFSPEGGEVRVSVKPLDRRFRISVVDQGPGIPDEFREKIFNKFAQADSSAIRTKGGTGLGLAIVREIVERLGGSVSFDSNPGEGTTFHVDLPAAHQGADTGRIVETIDSSTRSDLPLILHVDDDPDMLRIVAAAFDGRAQVQSSSSVAGARAAIDRCTFDAVILDVAMADGDGLDLVQPLRARQAARIAIFTAQTPEPSRVKDADVVLTKSIDSLDRLVSEVMTLAGQVRETIS